MNHDGRPMSNNKLVGDHDQPPKSIKKFHGGGLFLFSFIYIYNNYYYYFQAMGAKGASKKSHSRPLSGVHWRCAHNIFLWSPGVSLILWPSCIVPLFNTNGGSIAFIFFSFLESSKRPDQTSHWQPPKVKLSGRGWPAGLSLAH